MPFCVRFTPGRSRANLWYIVLAEPTTLLTSGGSPFTTGAAKYYDTATPGSIPAEPRIYIRIELASLGLEALAVVDTAAPWCILEPRLGAAVVDHFEELPGTVALSSRLGRHEGRLYLGTVKLSADEGEDLEVAATVFISPDWSGGNFVGYLGFLDRIRFAFEPLANMFYFGA